ncbi:unnamed protein product [Spodoptera littoralis]|uniref:Locomotion-related protein Hikaru genki n=1 Tax=Spodoptera littoralis TaxID=7109 RepID=A0A9P0N9P4_SPOLI|nr:unnamed protein product [Spodoptera littoralis]CAH1647501.1 unnamed protein product [Spodoptera littoralis]
MDASNIRPFTSALPAFCGFGDWGLRERDWASGNLIHTVTHNEGIVACCRVSSVLAFKLVFKHVVTSTIPDDFLSIGIDTSEIEHYDRIEFGKPRLRQLAAALAPARLRLGGTMSDRLIFSENDIVASCEHCPKDSHSKSACSAVRKLCKHKHLPFFIMTDDFKCSLPDVKSLDANLDITRFRSDFSKISEVKFPGLIGPLNERLICKIKCIDGNWVGPLCSNTPDGRFQPILRECLYKNEHPLLAISFKNSSINQPLRLGDAPPTIQYTIVSGSAVVEHSGELFVFPDSTLRLDCVSRRALGDPEWSWTQAVGQHTSAWSSEEGEKDSHYRLTLSKMSVRHSDQYTCTSPGGHTNTVSIKVVNVVCPAVIVTSQYIRQFTQGTKLGNSAHFSCQPGFHLNGSAILTCMGNGQWSSLPPTCEETFCPMLKTLGPHLSVVEYNSSFGGRAMFQCSWGYRLIGAPGLECEMDGKWSGEVPHCILTGHCASEIVK